MKYVIKTTIFFGFALFINGCSTKIEYGNYTPPQARGGEYADYKAGSDAYKYDYDGDSRVKSSVAMHRAKMKPYDVDGITYYPKIEPLGSKLRGIASWYGPGFHKKQTSNGEVYNMHAFTAAHKTLPMNTVVRVTNLTNSKDTVVRINDRGPFVDERIIDLSNAAAKTIDMMADGTVPVEVEILGYDKALAELEGVTIPLARNEEDIKTEVQNISLKDNSNSNSQISQIIEKEEPLNAPVVEPILEPLMVESIDVATDIKNNMQESSTKNVETISEQTIKSSTKVASIASEVTKSTQNVIKANSSIAIQIGSFKSLDGAEKVKNSNVYKGHDTIIKKSDDLYKVYIVGFSNYEEAKELKERENIKDGFIVRSLK